MKRIILVLVLLVTWSLASVPSLTSSAVAGEIQYLVPDDGIHGGPGTLESTGSPDDDDSEGDPNDQGDGYGAVGNPRVSLNQPDGDESDWSALDAYIFYLLLMVQQLAP